MTDLNCRHFLAILRTTEESSEPTYLVETIFTLVDLIEVTQIRYL